VQPQVGPSLARMLPDWVRFAKMRAPLAVILRGASQRNPNAGASTAQVRCGAHAAFELSACALLRMRMTVEVNEAGTWISARFFDVEDEFHVKVDLWLTASISIEIMDLLYGVNKGRDVVKFIPNFESNLQRIHQADGALVADMQSTDRYKRAFEILAGIASTS
jgi:hypothetical protein